MEEKELEIFKDKLKLYSFKYDDDLLKETTKYYSLTDCLKAYKSIIMNTPKLTGINILNELNEELKLYKPKQIERDIFYKNCALCENTGLISLTDEYSQSWSFCCKCGIGKKKSEATGYTQWNGLEPYKFRHQPRRNGESFGDAIEIIARLDDRYKERIRA